MNRSLASIVVAGAVLLASPWLFGPPHAQTTVDINGYNITINVPIDAANLDQAGAVCWKSKSEKMWNDAFDSADFKKGPKGCLKLKLNLDIRPTKLDVTTYNPKRHNMAAASNRAPADVAAGGFAGEPGEPRGDNTASYETARSGIFDSSFCDPTTDPLGVRVAHEVGHLMGLGDDYTIDTPQATADDPHPKRSTKPLDGWKHSLMADGGPITEPLLRRLVNLLKNATHNVPDCKWKGKLRSQTLGGSYDESGEVAFAFTESDDGNLNGSGQFRRLANRPKQLNPVCVQTRKYSVDEFAVTVGGRRAKDDFQMEFTPGVKAMTLQFGCVGKATGNTVTVTPFVPFLWMYDPHVPAEDGASKTFHEETGGVLYDGAIEIRRADAASAECRNC